MRNVLIVLLSICFAAGPASAGEAMVVRVGDLDLSTIAGASLAIQRMEDAAVKFCAGSMDTPGPMDVTTLTCRRDMALRAGRKLNHANVTARQAAGGATLLAQAAFAPLPTERR
jgi:UrcA family protein